MVLAGFAAKHIAQQRWRQQRGDSGHKHDDGVGGLQNNLDCSPTRATISATSPRGIMPERQPGVCRAIPCPSSGSPQPITLEMMASREMTAAITRMSPVKILDVETGADGEEEKRRQELGDAAHASPQFHSAAWSANIRPAKNAPMIAAMPIFAASHERNRQIESATIRDACCVESRAIRGSIRRTMRGATKIMNRAKPTASTASTPR